MSKAMAKEGLLNKIIENYQEYFNKNSQTESKITRRVDIYLEKSKYEELLPPIKTENSQNKILPMAFEYSELIADINEVIKSDADQNDNSTSYDSKWTLYKHIPVLVWSTSNTAPILLKLETLYDCAILSDNPTRTVHIYGNSGTGKEMVARLIADLTYLKKKKQSNNDSYFGQVAVAQGGGEMLLVTLLGAGAAGPMKARSGMLENFGQPHQTLFLDEIHSIDET